MSIIYLNNDGTHDSTRCSCNSCYSKRHIACEDDYEEEPDSIYVDHNNYICDIQKGNLGMFVNLF